jgi:hypothetical protein
MNMTLSTSTRIAPIVNVSTYDGPFGYESLWGADEESEREEGRFVCDDYDFPKMGERIVEEANRVFEVEKPLREYGVVSIKATEFGSPREYNFTTDWLDLEVEVDDSFWQLAKEAIFKPENRAAIVEYAGDHWVSYDGFSSAMLNRICTLSRDHWKHTHYGTHMATDKEVEDALLADLKDAFEGLAAGTSEDEFREFGAILALLWLIEYPSDFNRSEDSIYGSWVTDEMVESIRGNSSLSEFCTVLERSELVEKVGDSFIDFDAFVKELERSYEKYCKSGVGEDSQARAKAWLETVRKDVDGWKEKQTNVVEWNAPKWDVVKSELAELKEEWDAKLEAGWPGAWK